MTVPRTEGPVEVVVLDGGPMDGREGEVAAGTDELCVVMTDGQRHRYGQTGHVGLLPDGRSALVFAWRGRMYGALE